MNTNDLGFITRRSGDRAPLSLRKELSQKGSSFFIPIDEFLFSTNIGVFCQQLAVV